jgi:uncharacterized protein YodC (DUF2158 family)
MEPSINPPENQKFKRGDVVRFNGAHPHVPDMTVLKITDFGVVCFWFGKDWSPCIYAFEPDFLVRISERKAAS